MTFYPSDTQQSLLYQLNQAVYLSTEWWRIKEILENHVSPDLHPQLWKEF